MAKHANKKATSGQRNDGRKNGKAWKDGKSPEVRQAEAKAKAAAKRERKAAK